MNVVNWFEIPVTDMSRAVSFYEAVFSFKMHLAKLDGLEMAWFPWRENTPGSGGSLIYSPEFYKPSEEGTVVYFSVDDIEQAEAKVGPAGGEVLIKKRQISEEHGYMALFKDSEGNRIAVHSQH